MTKIILTSIAIILVAGSTYTLLPHPKSDSTPITINQIEEEEILKAPTIDDDSLLLDEEELKLEDLEEVQDIAPKEIEPEMVSENRDEVADIMVETDIEEVKNSFPTKEGVSPLIAIEILKGSIGKLKIGDKVSLPYMGAGEYEATITSKTLHKNGSVSISGDIIDSGNRYSMVLTEGKSMSFGTVTTPNGSFEIETKNGQGYVYSTDSIDQKWIDYSKSDTLETHQH